MTERNWKKNQKKIKKEKNNATHAVQHQFNDTRNNNHDLRYRTSCKIVYIKYLNWKLHFKGNILHQNIGKKVMEKFVYPPFWKSPGNDVV